MIRFTSEYFAGMMVGFGVAFFFVGIATQSDLVSPTILTHPGALFGGLAMIVGGGAWKMRIQAGHKS